jgi:hypothetical protein
MGGGRARANFPVRDVRLQLVAAVRNGNLVDQMATKEASFFGRVVLVARSHGGNSCRVVYNLATALLQFRLKPRTRRPFPNLYEVGNPFPAYCLKDILTRNWSVPLEPPMSLLGLSQESLISGKLPTSAEKAQLDADFNQSWGCAQMARSDSFSGAGPSHGRGNAARLGLLWRRVICRMIDTAAFSPLGKSVPQQYSARIRFQGQCGHPLWAERSLSAVKLPSAPPSLPNQ